MTKEMQECAKECSNCYETCVTTLQHCLEKGGRHVEPAHVRLMTDCIEICRASANFLLRGSALHHATCRACFEVCRKCADDCRRLADDKMMQACADACDRCAKSCEKMAASASR